MNYEAVYLDIKMGLEEFPAFYPTPLDLENDYVMFHMRTYLES